MLTKSAKAKGRRLQKLVAESLLAAFPHLTKDDIKPILMGGSGLDIQLSQAGKKDIPFGFECKNQEALNVWSSIAQAEQNAETESLTPALVFTRNRMREPYVAVPLSVFVRMLLHDSWERRSAASREGAKRLSEKRENGDDSNYEKMMRRSHKYLDELK